MGRANSKEPSEHALYMRKWRAMHPEYSEYQKQYQRDYLSNALRREAATRRASEYYYNNKERILKEQKDRYVPHPRQHPTGAEHPMWAGDDAKYAAIHAWVRRYKGTPSSCEHCGRKSGRLQWANKDHEYRRLLEDYIRLCAKCHYRYDVDQGLRPAMDPSAAGRASQKARKKRLP